MFIILSGLVLLHLQGLTLYSLIGLHQLQRALHLLRMGHWGRGPNDPKLSPEYMAQWEIIAASRTSGSYEYDNIHNCLPPGMPAMMGMGYGMEIMQSGQRHHIFQ